MYQRRTALTAGVIADSARKATKSDRERAETLIMAMHLTEAPRLVYADVLFSEAPAPAVTSAVSRRG